MFLNWNLSALYADEKRLERDVENVKTKAINFEKLCKNRLKTLSTSEFAEAIREYEDISEILGKIGTYAFLKFATDSSNGPFFAKYQKICADTAEYTLFFELEFNRLTKIKQQELIDATCKYKYFLQSIQADKPYQLSAKEERILLKKSSTGGSAFSRLFDEHFSRLKFDYEDKKISEEEILSLLHSPARDVRKNAAKAFSDGLRPHQQLLAYIYNMIKSDHKSDCELRGYKSAEQFRHQENKISQKSVDALIEAAEDNLGLVQDYYHKKADLLGIDCLHDYDRYAPLELDEEEYDFERSRDIVLKSFSKFSPQFADIASKAFDEGWIDVFPKDGKRGGAFSHPATTDAHPYVLLNHTNKRRDLFTLAHELGHAIHQSLSSVVGYFGSNTPLTTSETASVFAEMLVFDYIKDGLDDAAKIALYSSKIEDIFATLFRQINFTTFERRVHAHEGELDLATFEEYWLQESTKMFGDSVKLGKDYSMWWSYIPHFIHSPFYCYSYSYGQLLVLALYGLYKSGKSENFVATYVKFLSAGGSKSPKELVATFGFDIEDPAFWQIGIDEIRVMLDELKGMDSVARNS